MKVCMVAYTFYEQDNRVRRYAEALARRGDQVDAVVLRMEGQSSKDVIEGVTVYRIQRRVVTEKGKLTYLAKLLLFLLPIVLFPGVETTPRALRSRSRSLGSRF